MVTAVFIVRPRSNPNRNKKYSHSMPEIRQEAKSGQTRDSENISP